MGRAADASDDAGQAGTVIRFAAACSYDIVSSRKPPCNDEECDP